MKKLLLLSLVTLFAATTFAQSKSNNGIFHNTTYVHVGYGFPGGTFKSEGLVTAAAQFECGTMFYLNFKSLPEKLRLGIDVDYLSLSGMANKDSLSKSNKSVSYFTAGIKLGPCVSYNFGGDFIGDAYFKVYPHKFITGQKDVVYTAPTQTQFGTSFGLNLRWKALMLGCEFSSATYDFEKTSSSSARAAEAVENVSINLPVTVLSLGVNF